MRRLRPAALTLVVVIIAACAPRAAAEEGGEVPFTFEKGYVVVGAMVKGREPAEVVISTGAEYSTVDGGLLEKYRLQAYYTGVPPITGHNDRIISYAKVPDFRVGPAGADGLDMRLGSTVELSRALGREIFGILGGDFFRGRAVQFDFAKRVLRFLDKAAAEALRAKGGAAVLRMAERQNEFRRFLTVPAVEKVMFNDRPARVLLDTGLPVAVVLTSAAAKRLGFEAPPERGAARADSARTIQLGPVKLSDVPVAIYPKGSPADARLGDGGALAGSAFLQNFVATFDFRGRVVILEHL